MQNKPQVDFSGGNATMSFAPISERLNKQPQQPNQPQNKVEGGHVESNIKKRLSK